MLAVRYTEAKMKRNGQTSEYIFQHGILKTTGEARLEYRFVTSIQSISTFPSVPWLIVM